MVRLVKHDAHKPFVVRLGDLNGFKNLTSDQKVLDYSLHICACGLSKNKPFCDGSHKRTVEEQEHEIWAYDDAMNKTKLV